MRRIEQPGSGPAERIQWVEAHGRRFEMALATGLPLLEAVRRGLAEAGFSSGVVTVDGLALGPFAYVMPALSQTPDHAAFYSEIFRPAGVSRIETGAMTFGSRDGAPFFHCHALWTEADGRVNGGHILPDETILAEPISVSALGLDGAAFAAAHDPETNFKLFGPVAAAFSGASREGRYFALRVRPNVDFATALEEFCAERGIRRAVIHGGVGSTIGARFGDGRIVENFATEVAIQSGVIEPADGQLAAEIDVALVDFTGAMAQGRLQRGDNPVLMTFELVLEAF
ncbi:PCC domain-containing protein [Bosea sp. (in: a-proteobacteria)]|jgi:predicted DNA-binding protein with PD1-like motif|uniref:PCC domain-containing protein n=1 Tax=Bosea sp. (in: a-proteobacteria) TaxID=1871050 RepID=UPI003F72C2C3